MKKSCDFILKKQKKTLFLSVAKSNQKENNNKKNNTFMELKKSLSADLEGQKSLFVLIGFVVVLGFIYIFLEWSEREVKVYEDTSVEEIFEEEEMVLQTKQELPPPPPEPEVPVEIPPEIVVTEKEVETNTDAFITESKPSDIIAPPPPPPAPKVVEEKDDDVIFVAVEKAPEFPGGMKKLYEFMAKNLNYPSYAKEAGIQGRVICQFVVNTDGSIVDIKVARGVDPDLDQAAIEMIKKMPKWIPGEQARKKVRVKFTLPVVFKLQ